MPPKRRSAAARDAAESSDGYLPGSGITSYHVLIGDQKMSFMNIKSGTCREGKACRVHPCRRGPYRLSMSFEEPGA